MNHTFLLDERQLERLLEAAMGFNRERMTAELRDAGMPMARLFVRQLRTLPAGESQLYKTGYDAGFVAGMERAA